MSPRNQGRAINARKASVPVFARWWALGVAVIFVLAFALSPLDNFTELTPYHPEVESLSLVIGGIAASASAIVGFLALPTNLLLRLLGAVLSALMAFVSSFLLTSTLVDIVEGAVDFPASITRTYTATIAIRRAYETQGKGRSWNIQTQPLWSNITVTRADYDYMLWHRAGGAGAGQPDEILSNGFFCAKVIVQKAGSAIRILHAGRGNLPEGSVALCPPDGATLR